MKKIILALIAFVAFGGTASADGLLLKQNQATQIQIVATLITSGLATTSNSIPSGFSFSLVKHADSGTPTVSTWVPTNSAGTHDCNAPSGSFEWNCELTAGDVDTLGPLDVCWHYPSAFDDCNHYIVIASAAWDELVSGLGVNVLSMSNNAITAAATAPDAVDPPISVSYPNFTFPMFDSTGALKPGLAVTCQRSLGGGSLTNCDNAVSAVGGGLYKITFTAADAGNAEAVYVFSATGGRTQVFHVRFRN